MYKEERNFAEMVIAFELLRVFGSGGVGAVIGQPNLISLSTWDGGRQPL